MPLTATFTEELVRGVAPDEATFQKAKKIAQAKRFQNLGVSKDGSWLFGECQGFGRAPYELSADFHDPASPVLRSTSPGRKTPDSYGVALLLAYLNEPDAFGNREPTEDLLVKREKRIALDEKKKSGSAVPRKVTKTVHDKKGAAQREGMESLERMLVELVAGGKWFEASSIEKIEKLTKHRGEASLPASIYGLRKLMLIAKQKDLGEEDKAFNGAEVIGQIWESLNKARYYLAGNVPEGEPAEITDALIEDVTGKSWQVAELREKGCYQSDVMLYELAFERSDDEARQQRFEISNLIDVGSGAIHQAVTTRPFKGLSQVPEQTSFQLPVKLAEVAVCPGFVNRRVRWEKGTEHLIENPPAQFLEKVYAQSRVDFESALDAFREQLKHGLASREAVFFLRCERIGRIGDRVVIQDAEGTRMELKDRRKDYSNLSNLLRAAGMMGKENPAILVRLFMQPQANLIVAQPLAAVTPKNHLRLGL